MDVSNITQAVSSNPKLTRFVVRSSDIIQDMRVNVYEENSETVIWYKERFLGNDEIIENFVHNPTSTICWTIHRPKRGWYIRIRSPSFPPGVFIPLTPVAPGSPHHTEAALSFDSRTNIPTGTLDDDKTCMSPDDASTSSIHSYPPTPPAHAAQPPSPASVHAKLDNISTHKRRRFVLPSTQTTQFILAPHSTQQITPPQSASFFTRALSVLKNHRPSHSNSFTLSRVPITPPTSPPPPYAQDSLSNVDLARPSTLARVPVPAPVLVFHDRTPVLTVRSLTGLIEINQTEEQLLGVESSFWIAVALTYLEFLEERESYLAALSD